MNIQKLQDAEAQFFARYPGGFEDPAIVEIVKKHKIEKMNKLAQESFAQEKFEDVDQIVASMSKLVTQSSLVSIFEKPKFRDMTKVLDHTDKEYLALGLQSLLYGDEAVQARGFLEMASVLADYKIAKWPLLTVYGVYFRPADEVFIKPTTVKAVIDYFELEGLKYNSSPTYAFYQAYRQHFLALKAQTKLLTHLDNGAFSGFLMMSLAEL